MSEKEDNNREKRPLIRSELDLSLLTTDSVWGKNDINKEFKQRTAKQVGYWVPRLDEKGEPVLNESGDNYEYDFITEEEFLWNTLGFFTRDFRLGNLSKFDGEVNYCEYYTNLAGDLLHERMKKSFNISLSRVAGKLELSQSSGGFLRRRMNTLTQEHFQHDIEPKKVSLFGKTKETN